MHRLLSVFALLYLVAYTSGQGVPTEGELDAAANGATPAPTVGGGGGGGSRCYGGGGRGGGTSGGRRGGGGGGGGRDVCGLVGGGGGGSISNRYTCSLHWCPIRYIYRRYTTSSLYRCSLICPRDSNCYAWTYIPHRNLCLLYHSCTVRTYCLWEAAGGYNGRP